MQVESFLEFSAQKYPDKVALVLENERWTYGQIEEQANRIAHSVIDAGVQRGDRVVICLPTCAEAVVAVFATLKAGAVFVVVNHSTKPEKLAFILNNCRAAVLVSWHEKLQQLSDRWQSLPHLRAVLAVGTPWEWFVENAPGKVLVDFTQIRNDGTNCGPPPKQCIDIDLAALIYTSGSTGSPKGVMLTHLNIVSAATSITTYLENTPDDIVINVLPLSFDYGLYQVLMMFKVGGRVILEESFSYPFRVIDRIMKERVTGFPIVPTISAMLLQMDLSKYEFPHLRYLTNTAAALPIHHIRQLRQSFPTVKLYSMYGLTECKRVSYLPPEQLDIRPGSVGRGMPNEEVYLVNEEGNRLGPGNTGELVVRGSNVMKGYWELPEETHKYLKPGPVPGENVLYTGDIFRTDEEGYLYFVGRKDDIIKTRGEKVSPREVEDVISACPGVAEVAVIGVPDPVLGSAIKAVVKLRAGATTTRADILRQCVVSLEDFMVPKIVEFTDAMPTTDSGKVSKRAIAGHW